MRNALHTQSWQRAKEIIASWELTGALAARIDVPTITAAVNTYLDECVSNKFAELTVYHHRKTLERFAA